MIKLYHEHKFIFAAGIAAFIHSTWSLAIFMSGNLPATPAWGSEWRFYAGWIIALSYKLIPAALLAYAFDVGQINTAREIREGNRAWGKIAAFITFAVATFFLQYLFVAHHMPLVDISSGAAPAAAAIGVHLRNAAVWIIPALLPAATILYTIGDSTPSPQIVPENNETSVVIVPDVYDQRVLEAFEVGDDLFSFDTPTYTGKCHKCGKEFTKDSQQALTNALNRHLGHCDEIAVVSSNGQHH